MTHRRRTASSTLLLLMSLLPACLYGQAAPNTVTPGPAPKLLELKKTESAELTQENPQPYIITLRDKEFMQVVVTKPRIGIVVRFRSAAGEGVVAEMNVPSTSDPDNPLCWVAKHAGDYMLEITASSKVPGTMEYKVRLDDLHPATADDEKRVTLQTKTEQVRAASRNHDYDGAIRTLNEMLPIARELKDRSSEALVLSGIGGRYSATNRYQEAIPYYEQALEIRRDLSDQSGMGSALNNLAICHYHLGEYEKATAAAQQAIDIARKIGNRTDEANALHSMARVYLEQGRFEQSRQYFESAVAIRVELKDRMMEGRELDDLGSIYHRLGQNEKAISYQERALAINREVGDTLTEGHTLNNLAGIYTEQGQYEKGIGLFQQALAIQTATKDRQGQANSLLNMGISYEFLGQEPEAIANFEKGIALAREISDRKIECNGLIGMGETYIFFGEQKKGIDSLEKALTLSRQLDNHDMESEALTNLVSAYVGQDSEKAISLGKQAVTLARETKDRRVEGAALSSLGDAYASAKQMGPAMDSYSQALGVERQVEDRQTEIQTLSGMMDASRESSRPRLAIFFGKQAVNEVQSIRADIHGLNPGLRKSFLAGNEKPYHTLADLLIAQGRLTEAEQVLNLLKEEEYFDFVRRDSQESSSLTQHADLTPDEATWEKRYREIGGQLVALGTERGELLDKKNLTPDETRRLAQLDQDLAVGNAAFEKFLTDLSDHFTTQLEADTKIEQLREAQGLMQDLRELPKGTVAVYTLVGEDKYRAILVTPDVQKAYEYPITGAELNRKILSFRQAVEDPKVDPRPQAQELYKILVANLAGDLRQARAKTVMWSLDGALRYLPIAALYDGKHYLVEQYALSVFTPASNARLKDRPDRDWTAAGFGVTKAQGGAPALPAVATELAGIIRQKPGESGVLAGEIKLDEQFTQEAMRQTLLKHYPVVHIASHFHFQPGNETDSFLLLGDGSHLSLADLKSLPNFFGGVQLLTLSACSTGVGDASEDGKEVEGLGVLAQRKGAKGVVASLWSVADQSTSLLMQDFYRRRESAATTKADALRGAQLAMLKGTLSATGAAASNRELVHEEASKAERLDAPKFAVDSRAPYAHPYYWAPFFLMGDWL